MENDPHISRRGFTLLELMITLAVIALFMSISLFSLKGLNFTAEGEKEASELTALVRKAKRTADSDGFPMVVMLREGGVELLNPSGLPIESVLFSENTQLQIQDAGGKWNPVAERPWLFEPKALCDPLSLRLQNGDFYATMKFDPLTGLTIN